MKYHRGYIVLLSAAFILLSQLSCISAGADQQQTKQIVVDNNLVNRARQATQKYKLSTIPTACLAYEVIDEKYEGKPVVDVHEIHNSQCGGDPQTSPRVFSIAIDSRTGEIWSDAKSLVGQMEMVGKE